ncbi:hypothetical protein GGS21DRAFT_342190 [Xylaria nigripes]|nr:hypothetical protein GGS21DRAFT_342190 [Xylaria nigripes]
MPPAGKKQANFRTYEAAMRLLAAVIATNPGIKLDFTELANHVGGETTKSAIDHRLRPIKQLAKMQSAYVKMGKDPGDLPAADKGEIQKCFGESTPGGIEWQFRDIKSLAKAQKQAIKDGENPATLQPAGTPSASRAKVAGVTTPSSSRKRKTPLKLDTPDVKDLRNFKERIEIDDDDDSDYCETPTRTPVAKKARPTYETTPSTKSNGNVTATARISTFGHGATSTESFTYDSQASTSLPVLATEHTTRPVSIKEDPFIGASMSSGSMGSLSTEADYLDGEI